MATATQNLGLVLPDGNEKVSRQVLNGNFTMIDTAVGNITGKDIPTVTQTLVESGVLIIIVKCTGFVFGDGFVVPVLFPEDIETENASSLMMDIGSSGIRNLELHITATTTFNNISAGVHFVECTTHPLQFAEGTETYALYETGICGAIDGMHIADWLDSKADKENPSFQGNITMGEGTADEVTLTATQLKQLLELLN